jgi:hypothetical protein
MFFVLPSRILSMSVPTWSPGIFLTQLGQLFRQDTQDDYPINGLDETSSATQNMYLVLEQENYANFLYQFIYYNRVVYIEIALCSSLLHSAIAI